MSDTEVAATAPVETRDAATADPATQYAAAADPATQYAPATLVEDAQKQSCKQECEKSCEANPSPELSPMGQITDPGQIANFKKELEAGKTIKIKDTISGTSYTVTKISESVQLIEGNDKPGWLVEMVLDTNNQDTKTLLFITTQLKDYGFVQMGYECWTKVVSTTKQKVAGKYFGSTEKTETKDSEWQKRKGSWYLEYSIAGKGGRKTRKTKKMRKNKKRRSYRKRRY
jgi:hypothetical protein